MSVTAKFAADFSTFTDAVNKADVALADFSKGAEDVETKLNRMVDNFSGRQLIQQATLMAEAVEQVGGASTLTEQQLTSLGNKAQEAVAKMQKLGLDVPENLQKLADAAAAASNKEDGLGSSFVTAAQNMTAAIVSGQLIVDLLEKIASTALSAAEALPQIVMAGAKFGDIQEAFSHLTEGAGLLADTLIGRLRDGVHGTVSDMDLMAQVNQTLTAGVKLTGDQFGLLSDGAYALAKATGKDTAEAFNALTDAMTTGRVRGIQELTGKIDLTAAEDRYAATLDKSRDELTQQQKTYADQQTVLAAVQAGLGRLGEQTENLDDHVEQARVAWQNFTNDLGKAIAQSPVLEAGYQAIAKALADAFGGSQQNLIKAVTTLIEQGAIKILDLGDATITTGGVIAKEWEAAKVVFGDVAQAIDYVTLAQLKAERAGTWINSLIDPSSEATAKLADLDKQIAQVNDSIDARGKSLQDAKAAEDAVDQTTAKYHTTLDGIRQAMVDAAAAENDGADAAKKHGDALKGVGAATDDVIVLSAKQRAELEKQKQAWQDLMTVGTSYQDTLAQMNQGTRTVIEALLAQGASMQSIATIFGLTASQVKAFTDELKDNNAEIVLSQKNAQKTAEIWNQYFESIGSTGQTAYDKLIAAADKWRNDQYAKFQGSEDDWKAFIDAVESRYQQMVTNAGVNQATLSKNLQSNLQQTLTIEQNTLDVMQANWWKYSQAAIDAQQAVVDAARHALDTASDDLTQYVGKAVETLDQMRSDAEAVMSLTIPGGKPGSAQEQADLAKVMAQVSQSNLGQAVAHGSASIAMQNQYQQMIDDAMAALGYQANAIGTLPGRATGGPVEQGQPYIVGEEGPELYVPNQSGTILPNGVRININGSVLSDEQKIAKAVGGALIAALKSQGVRLNA